MSVSFADHTEDLFATLPVGLVTNKAKVVACWSRVSDINDSQWMTKLSSTTETDNALEVWMNGNGGDASSGFRYQGTGSYSRTVFDVVTANTWHLQGCCYGAAGADGGVTKAFFDGIFSGQNGGYFASSTATEALTNIIVGNSNSGNPSRGHNGQIAELSIWEADTNADAEAILNDMWNSGSPLAANNMVQTPVHYWPLLSDGVDVVGGTNLSLTGTPTFDSGVHPTVLVGGGGVSNVQHVGHFV